MNSTTHTKEIPESLIRSQAWQMCPKALDAMGGTFTPEVWCGKYGEVLVSDDGEAWVGDLCYMREKFGWTHDEYMQAYGYMPGKKDVCATEGLRIHEFGGKSILIVGLGGDGAGPLGTGIDTGSIAFVSTSRNRVEKARGACIRHLASA
jgi:hypothetical protein